jgi:TonB-dependent SusC/RagA subfamily outer membrane receptor
MKKVVLQFIATICLITGLLSKANAQSDYTAKLNIPPSGDTRKALTTTSEETDFSRAFPNVDLKSKNKKLIITSASIESTDPAKTTATIFRSIKIYLVKGDGSNEVLIGANTNIPPTVGNKVVVNLSRQLSDKAQGVDPNATIETIFSRLPGVQVSAGEIRVRGADAAPLFLVDGAEKRGIQGLDPTDILSINVLKDASETGIYGVRGSNGVIVIKTRSANQGVGKNSGSLANFEQDSKVIIKLEYVLRAPLSAESSINISLGSK